MARSNSQVSTIEDDDVTAPAAAPQPSSIRTTGEDLQLSGKRQTITIHSSDSDAGDEPVFVGLNGYGYYIKRGTPVDLPVEVVEVLKNAKTDIVRTTQGGGQEVRTSQRFAFSFA